MAGAWLPPTFTQELDKPSNLFAIETQHYLRSIFLSLIFIWVEKIPIRAALNFE